MMIDDMVVMMMMAAMEGIGKTGGEGQEEEK
jgi:hypothetical protein